jgi:hypothetical protein
MDVLHKNKTYLKDHIFGRHYVSHKKQINKNIDKSYLWFHYAKRHNIKKDINASLNKTQKTVRACSSSQRNCGQYVN